MELATEPSIDNVQANGNGGVRKSLTRSQREFDAAFNEAIMDCGQPYHVDGDTSALVQAVRVEQIRPYFARRWAVDVPEKRTRDKRISEAFRGVLKKLPPHYYTRNIDTGDSVFGKSTAVELIWRLSERAG